ncbi:MAG: EFR1 family ferrodoxin [Oscillospiraceae bacterium]|nr:EFR1 family ferrodoxin [Oscillospiraceae bacterium]
MVMLYFSGTGNSKYVAELFCRRMNAACHSVEEEIDFNELITSENIIGFCYPVYGSRVPRIMREFVKSHMESLKNKNLVIFCTQMYFSGDGARAFTDIFLRGYANVIYAEHFLMPNNVCNVFITPLPSQKTIKKYITKAERKMRTVCDHIENGVIKKRGFNPGSRALGLIQGVFYPKLEKMTMNKVRVGSDCTQCNLCVEICPMNNFEKENGKIIPKNNCTICYRCINRCPQKAITIYFKGKIKKQYKGLII